jgi:peptidyl-prolyl cis-trans isomerase C
MTMFSFPSRSRSVPFRRGPILGTAGILAVFLVLGGCSHGPKPESGPGAKTQEAKVWHPAKPDTLGPVVGVVGGRKFTRHEVDSVLASLPSSMQDQFRQPENYKELVTQLMTQEVFYQAAKGYGIERDSSYQRDLDLQIRDLMVRHYFDRVLKALPDISEDEVRAYYNAHPDEFKIAARARVRHIALPSRSKAVQVRNALVKGALWDATCAKYSTDKATRQNGGLLGWVGKDADMVPGVGNAPGIVAAAYSLPIDKVSQPIKSEKSWHLIKVETREDASLQPFNDVKDRTKSRMLLSRRQDFGKTLSDSLLKYYNATVFEDSIKVALTPEKTAADLFKEAQAAATPMQRIDLYRTLIKRFPTDSVSIQAQFMIGFTYAEEMHQYDLARQEFQTFLKEHASSDLAGSAKWMLENMDKPPPTLEEKDEGDSAKGDLDDDDQGTKPKPPSKGSPKGSN